MWVAKLVLVVLAGLGWMGTCAAQDLVVLSGRALIPALNTLATEFERSSALKVTVLYDTARNVRDRVLRHDGIDVAILPLPEANELVEQGEVKTETLRRIARSLVGMGVQPGGFRPDVRSVEAFRYSILKATALVCADPAKGAATGRYFEQVLRELAIWDEIKTRVRFVQDSHTAVYVARGEADVAVQLANEILEVPGVELILLPAAFQTDRFTFMAGVPSRTAHAASAQAFIDFLQTPAAVTVLKAKNLYAE